MLNQTVIIGRLVSNPEITQVEERSLCNIQIAVPRNYKNDKGEYETDFVPVMVWDGIATNLNEYCHKGDLVGVKGRIEMKDNQIIIIAEKITFLSSKKDTE